MKKRITPAEAPRRHGDSIFIDGGYQHKARTEGFVVQRFWHWEKERIVRKFCAPSPGDRVIDVGCGSGVVTDLLASLGARATGIDANPSAIEYAQRTFARPNLDFKCSLVEDLDFEPGSVDRIYCLEVIEHLYEHQVRSLLALLQQLLRPGGVLTLTTPNYHGLWPAVEFAMDRLRVAPQMADHQHVTRFHRGKLRELFTQTGWVIQTLMTFSTFAPFLSMVNWKFAERCAEAEDRLVLPFGNILLVIATTKESTGAVSRHPAAAPGPARREP